MNEDLKDIIIRAQATPWGKTCSALWAKAAQLATDLQDEAAQVLCYSEICNAYALGGESTKVLAPFIWEQNKFSTNPELFNEEQVNYLGWHYKYVISVLRTVPSFPTEKCLAMLKQMHDFYLQQGDTLRAYYIRAYLFYRDFGMLEEAEINYQNWKSTPLSELSDCTFCDPSYAMSYHSLKEEWELAAKVADKNLKTNQDYCDSQPEAMLTEALLPWLYCNRDSEAWAAHIRAYRRFQQSVRYLEFLPEHLKYLAISGRSNRPERLERGINIITRHIPWIKEAEHPKILMHLCSAITLLLQSPTLDPNRHLNAVIPGDSLMWIEAPVLENPTFSQAANWFLDIAQRLAKQFDNRPGHPHPGTETAILAKALSPSPAPAPVTQAVPDVSGVITNEDNTYLNVTNTINECNSQVDESIAQLTNTNSTPTETATEVIETDIVPINLQGSWRGITLVELLQKMHSNHLGEFSIYAYCAIEKIALSNNSPNSTDPILNKEEKNLLNLLTNKINALLSIESYEFKLDDSDDSAYQLLQQAHAANNNNEYMQAAQLADQAMRTISIEPIGVRIQALTLLGETAAKAGYPNEAISYIRQAVNLCAACGIYTTQIVLYLRLALILADNSRWLESAEVSQIALDISNLPQNSKIVCKLHEALATACTKLSHYETAAKQYQILGNIAERANDITQASHNFQTAANLYQQGGIFSAAFSQWNLTIRLLKMEFNTALQNYNQAFAKHPTDQPLDESIKNIRQNLIDSTANLYNCYYDYSKCLVLQPGQVSEHDMAKMEELMQAYKELQTQSPTDQFFEQQPAWREANFLHELSYMYWNCYKYVLAFDYIQAALNRFHQLGDVVKEAQCAIHIATMHYKQDNYSQALEYINQCFSLLQDPQYIAHNILQEAKKIKHNLDNQKPA